MSLTAKDSGGGDFKLVPPGTHIGVCNMIADIGLQETVWAGEAKVQPKVYIRWEIPGERTDDDRPLVIGCLYTNSLGKKAYLRRDLEAWRGRAFTHDELLGFDLTNIAGRACQINVIHSEDGQWANVSGLAGMPKGMDHPKAENPIILFDSDNPHNLDELPAWLQEKYNNRVQSTPVDQRTRIEMPETGAVLDMSDEIPF